MVTAHHVHEEGTNKSKQYLSCNKRSTLESDIYISAYPLALFDSNRDLLHENYFSILTT
ncbi:MAG: hypothetical protein XU11_C0006G0018 [Candidatus Dadabacteria bacterium CSP1-2]|nr:MAG: hypothetical protein XU11_C0006G0018 [Candidatus Dadabacteria bacterium CSP1-2]